MIYNISFDICAVVMTIAAFYTIVFQRDVKRPSNRIFLVLIIMHFFAAVFDIWSSVCNSYIDTYSFALRDFTNVVFLGVHTSEAVVFLLFLLVQLGLYRQMHRAWRVLLFLPELCLVLLPLALNPVMHGVFAYDTQGYYAHGFLMPLLYIGADLYMLLAIGVVWFNRKRLTKGQLRAALLLLVLSLVPMLVQSLLLPRQLIEIFFQAVGLYGYLQSVENIDEYYHPVTKLKNRNTFVDYLIAGFIQGASVDVIIIKLSQTVYLKMIMAGSTAFHGVRVRMADWLKKTLGYQCVYDCDGGIFTILLPHDKTKTDDACDAVAARFEKLWRYRDFETTFPIQLTKLTLPDAAKSVDDLMPALLLPYVHEQEGVERLNGEELFAQYQAAQQGDLPELPPKMTAALNRFSTGLMSLTPAERNIAGLYAAGYEIADIPEKAFISMNTVKKHNRNIYRKLGVKSREEFLLYVDLFEGYLNVL